MIDEQIDGAMQTFLEPDYGAESFAAAAGNLLSVELEARDFRNASFDDAVAAGDATRPAARPSRRCSTRSRRTCPTDAEDESRVELGGAGPLGEHAVGARTTATAT